MTQTVPLSIEQITLSPDGLNLLLLVSPNNTSLCVKEIAQLLQHPTLPKFKLNIEGMNKAVELFESLIQNDKSIDVTSSDDEKSEGITTDSDDNVTTNDIEPIIVASKRDALLNIVITEDNMSAYAEITTAYGGQSISLSDMKQRCAELGIKFGLIPKSMLRLINTCKQPGSGKTYKVNIANGKLPIDGNDSSFVKLIDTDNHRKPKPVMLDNGKVDMHNLGKTIAIDANTLLMEQIPATDGTPGKTVLGEAIEQVKGIAHPFGECKNVQVDPSNPLHLRSTSHGIPIDEGQFIRVDDVLLLHDISVKTGNVDYDGTIIITGDVHEGMKVKTSGDITVMGVIESADIFCGGDLTTQMPIIGRQKKDSTTFSCKIECKGNLRGTIAQYTRFIIGKDLILDNQLMHCDTDCKGSVLVYNEAYSQGSIIGGVTRANNNVITTLVGTNAGNKTMIDLTGGFKQLNKDKKEQTNLVQEVEAELQKIKKAELRADSLLDPDDKKETKFKLIKQKQTTRDKSDACQNDLKETKHKLVNYIATTNLTATSMLYSGVTVLIGNSNACSSRPHGPSTVSLDSNEIIISPYQRK